MLIMLLIIIPLIGALLSVVIPSNHHRPRLLPATGSLHFLLTIAVIISSPAQTAGEWIHLDAIGKIFLLEFSVLFTACAWYSVTYLQYRQERDNKVLCMGLQVCLAAMTLSTVAHHLGLLWLAIETTTLTMAPLIYFNSNARSIEATWKYMLICSVGIALAFLGILFLAYSTVVAGFTPTLVLEQLQSNAPQLSPVWLHAAFILLLVGYGTKMGLVPMHTWKPDAYGEAPGLVGALLAGGLANCGLLGLVRIYQVCMCSADVQFFRVSLIGMGLLSISVAAIFLLKQTDFKRMLAYSSVEQMGLFSLALGIGGKALYGFILQLIGNGLIKGVLFLSAGNLHRAFASKSRDAARGALKRAPWSGAIFLAGFFALTGSPPFLPFFGEFSIFSAAFSQGYFWSGSLTILCMVIAFLGMSLTVIPVVFGDAPKNRERTKYQETVLLVGPPLALLVIMGALGLWLPLPLYQLISEAAALLEVAQ